MLSVEGYSLLVLQRGVEEHQVDGLYLAEAIDFDQELLQFLGADRARGINRYQLPVHTLALDSTVRIPKPLVGLLIGGVDLIGDELTKVVLQQLPPGDLG